ncbi:MAG: hypothetical protein Q9183_007664 [Haloplaca sp. 2 TL-2023]
MFDLSQNLPIIEDSASESENENEKGRGWGTKKKPKKRKRVTKEGKMMIEQDEGYTNGDTKYRKERDTGAGSKAPMEELHTGIGRKMRKVEGEKTAFVHLDNHTHHQHQNPDDDENEEPEQGTSKALLNLRRGENTSLQHPTESPAFWATYKYRPILGIVPIKGRVEDEDDEDGEQGAGRGKGVEVALVERPMFEVDLPGRYHGDQEWGEKKDANVGMGR